MKTFRVFLNVTTNRVDEYEIPCESREELDTFLDSYRERSLPKKYLIEKGELEMEDWWDVEEK